MRLALVAMVLAVAAPAAASSVSNELGGTSSQETQSNPRSGTLTDSFNARIDLGDQWTLLGGVSITLEGKTAAAERGAFGSSGDAVTLFSLGTEFAPDDHWTFGLVGSVSPDSTQYAGTQVVAGQLIGGADLIADARVKSKSSQDQLGFDVTYDTAGDSNLEWSFNGGVTATHFETTQDVTEIRTASGATETRAQLLQFCQAHPLRCPRSLRTVLRQTPATLNSLRLTVGAAATLWQDTDVGLDLDSYAYSEDPADVGYFSLASAGRTANLGGVGVAVAPLRAVVRPYVAQRFGDFSARLWLQGGAYVDSVGGTTGGAGLKLQYRFSKAWRAWLTAAVQRDTDEQGDSTRSGSLALGGAFRF